MISPPKLCAMTMSLLSFAVLAASAFFRLLSTPATMGPSLPGSPRVARYTKASPAKRVTVALSFLRASLLRSSVPASGIAFHKPRQAFLELVEQAAAAHTLFIVVFVNVVVQKVGEILICSGVQPSEIWLAVDVVDCPKK